MEGSHFTWKCLLKKRKMYCFLSFSRDDIQTFFPALVGQYLSFGGSFMSPMKFWDLSRGAMAENGHVSYEM